VLVPHAKTPRLRVSLAAIKADAKLRVHASSVVQQGESTDGMLWVLSITDDTAEFWSHAVHVRLPAEFAVYVPDMATKLTSTEFAVWLRNRV